MTKKRGFGHCLASFPQEVLNLLFALLKSIRVGLMLWASSSVVFLLHRHQQSVQHVHRTGACPTSSPGRELPNRPRPVSTALCLPCSPPSSKFVRLFCIIPAGCSLLLCLNCCASQLPVPFQVCVRFPMFLVEGVTVPLITSKTKIKMSTACSARCRLTDALSHCHSPQMPGRHVEPSALLL